MKKALVEKKRTFNLKRFYIKVYVLKDVLRNVLLYSLLCFRFGSITALIITGNMYVINISNFNFYKSTLPIEMCLKLCCMQVSLMEN